MADENISIEIADKVSPSISNKLVKIAENARLADAAVKNLQSQLAALNTGALNVILQGASNATKALQNTTLAAQKLATEQQRTATAAAQAAAHKGSFYHQRTPRRARQAGAYPYAEYRRHWPQQ